jgi:hypothetical protein
LLSFGVGFSVGDRAGGLGVRATFDGTATSGAFGGRPGLRRTGASATAAAGFAVPVPFVVLVALLAGRPGLRPAAADLIVSLDLATRAIVIHSCLAQACRTAFSMVTICTLVDREG